MRVRLFEAPLSGGEALMAALCAGPLTRHEGVGTAYWLQGRLRPGLAPGPVELYATPGPARCATIEARLAALTDGVLALLPANRGEQAIQEHLERAAALGRPAALIWGHIGHEGAASRAELRLANHRRWPAFGAPRGPSEGRPPCPATLSAAEGALRSLLTQLEPPRWTRP